MMFVIKAKYENTLLMVLDDVVYVADDDVSDIRCTHAIAPGSIFGYIS